jgi:metallophosphoesterase (TIGR00282 family)
MINVLFVGDINGKPGRNCIKALLPDLIKNKKIDFTIANAENVAGGFGLTYETFNEIKEYGIDVATMGNHIWDNKDIFTFIQNEANLLRPANLPAEVPGQGYGIFSIKNSDIKIGVINLNGRIFMAPAECPFKTAEKIINEINKKTPIIIVDIHAEATSEKQAMGFFLDGKVSAVVGTHTHVQTADERILPDGTGFITDAGMTGPFDSVIGVKKDIIIRRFLTGLPEKFEIANNDIHLNGIIFSIDPDTGKTKTLERINIKYENS